MSRGAAGGDQRMYRSVYLPLRLMYFWTLCVHHREHKAYLIFNEITLLIYQKQKYRMCVSST